MRFKLAEASGLRKRRDAGRADYDVNEDVSFQASPKTANVLWSARRVQHVKHFLQLHTFSGPERWTDQNREATDLDSVASWTLALLGGSCTVVVVVLVVVLVAVYE